MTDINGENIAGIIGNEFIKNQILSIDNERSVLRIDTFIDSKKYDEIIPFQYINGRIYLPVELNIQANQTHKANLLVDLGIKNKKTISSSDGDVSINELEKVSMYINDPYPNKVDNPRVYIYNSHQLENYNNKNLEMYNITPNVMMASYLLKEKLNKINIPTIVEEANIIEFMKINNWVHKDSYKASRFYIIETMEKYNNLDLIIDLHRDDLTKKDATTTINNKKYAKVLFVVGLKNPKYEANLNLAKKIDNLIQKKYPTLSRGILTKKGVGVDGIYNQDLSSKMILLELGGQHSTIDEVLNTIEVMSHIIKEIIGDN